MGFGVFIHRADSPYEDSPADRYQFPKQYLSRVANCVGDWIIYYEPTKVSQSKGYNAIARVAGVVPDPTKSEMHIALIEPGSYLEFSDPVPFVVDGELVERGLLNAQRRVSGRAQAAVRPISPADFDRILSRGISSADSDLSRTVEPAPAGEASGFELDDAPAEFVYEIERDRVSALTTRIVRDRVFRRVVLRAYDACCAVSGLKLINGGGRAEVAAAHIRPVEHHGPDIVNNGISLSGTAHWMFDRGLITLTDDLEILVSRHVNDRDGADSFINKSRRLIGPLRERDRPHPVFLSWHRENCFKQ